ncbi:hypothetical protein SAMN05518672_103743 [Chitinophaga sp. CF118]|uniref:hypothetical protein n=1 Tax=Chitinophaga sp. CF118 TaxID=1884367 RepID=UPI0008E89A53|nr:hypothetical protein [Chitinophaga sp. CF118]SFD89484.1 hypothetical protein SAMN05518672_103743 [Chitinophaga sp. CF118]
MAETKITATTPEQLAQLLYNRQTFLLNKVFTQDIQKFNSITAWEEITCVGYNPEKSKLEAIVSIKQATGYSGGLCTNGSREYVRFFVDFKDGNGFQDMGYSGFKVADISELPAGPQHPLKYMTHLFIDDEKHRKFLDCRTAVIPTVRAVLSWNTIPSGNPNAIPYYGNVKDVNIQLKRRTLILWGDIFNAFEVKVKPDFLAHINVKEEVHIPAPPLPPIEALYQTYQRAKVPDHRTFYSSIAPVIANETQFIKAPSYNLFEIQKLKVNIKAITDLILKPVGQADVTFEELQCVGLNTALDTLGAVVRIKKSSGFSGDLCHNGSKEHVAFWADWDNNGTFDQYLGTSSITVHDIDNIPADGLCYNVDLPVNLNGRIRTCALPNVIRIRAVLSWQSLPSTTNPNLLNTWGNRLDAVVQIRPSQAPFVDAQLTLVGSVDRDLIDPLTFLVNSDTTNPTSNNNRPYGGWVSFNGIIDRNGFNGVIKYKIEYKKYGASDLTYAPISTAESFHMINFIPNPNVEFNDAQVAPDGWFTYKQNPAIGLYNEYNYLGGWSTGALADGNYTIRFTHTDANGNEQIADLFSLVVCNVEMSISQTANTSVDLSKSLDLVIDGGDCHCYDKTPNNHFVNGHLRAVHPYFANWSLDLQPSSHTHGTVPNPSSRYYDALPNAGDIGNLANNADDGDDNAPWSVDVSGLDNCGYTVSLAAHTRVIRNSSTQFPWYGIKAVGFSVTDICPNK